jgi:hypothetical protein
MPFDASKPEIVQLDYDFRPYVNASGRTPEPTEDMIYDFQVKVRDTAKLLGRDDIDPNDRVATVKFLRSLTKDDMKQVNSKIFSALAELTQGRPSYDEMMALNQNAYRLGQAYVGSLMGDLMNPKGVTRDTTA